MNQGDTRDLIGFTSPVSRIDLRVGGEYQSCMRSPDGKDFWSKGIFREIVAPERRQDEIDGHRSLPER